MGVMVLDTKKGQMIFCGLFPGILGGEMVGMEIMDQRFRLKAEEFLKNLNRCLEVFQRLQILQVSDVLAQEGIVVPGYAEGILQLRTTGQDRTRGIREFYGIGGVSPGPAKGLGQQKRLFFSFVIWGTNQTLSS